MRIYTFFISYWGLFFILLLSFFAIKPIFLPGFFPMHDDTQVTRMFEMGKALKDGMFPVRWVSDLGYGYGYPVFNFYAPLAYYFGGFFVLFGVDALLATKCTIIVGMLLSGISMYFLARNFWKETGGVLAGLFYVYATYHAVDLYVRGDISELWAYWFVPFVFLGVYKIFSIFQDNRRNSRKVFYWSAFGAIAYTGVILSHNLTAFILTLFLIPVMFVCILFSRQKFLIAVYYLLITFFGLLLSAFYWLPVLFESQYTNVLSQIGGTADFHQHFICLEQFWYSPWGYGGSIPGCVDGLSFMLGKIYILFGFFSFVGIFILWKKERSRAITLLISFVGWIISLFLTTKFSIGIWNSIKPLVFLQYPWRFLLIATVFSSFFSGSISYIVETIFHKKLLSYFVVFVSIVFLLFLQVKIFVPQKSLAVSSHDYTSIQIIRWKISKISDEYLPKDFIKPKGESEVFNTSFFSDVPRQYIAAIKNSTQEKKITSTLFSKTNSAVRLAYFPAWHYFIDTVETPYDIKNGKLFVALPQGKHMLMFRFEQTHIEVIGNILSLTGLFVIFLGIIALGNKKPHHEKTNN